METFDDEKEKKSSQFNMGVAKAIRLDNLITKYNNASISPFCYDYEMFSLNYKIMFEITKRLFMEAVGKLDEDEKNSCQRRITALEYFIEKYPIAEFDSANKIIINAENWKVFKEKLDELETLIRVALDEHDLDSPTKKRYMGL